MWRNGAEMNPGSPQFSPQQSATGFEVVRQPPRLRWDLMDQGHEIWGSGTWARTSDSRATGASSRRMPQPSLKRCSRGLSNFCVGKWHVGTSDPTRHGFEQFYGTLIGAQTFWIQLPTCDCRREAGPAPTGMTRSTRPMRSRITRSTLWAMLY
jgi:hypothetical protein